MLFIVMILAPLLRSPELRTDAIRMLQVSGNRFKKIGWSCFGLLIVTGFLNAGARWGFASLFTAGFWATANPGAVLRHKLLFFGLVLGLSFAHDFITGPKAVAAMRAAPGAPETIRLRKTASWFGRVNLLLALLILWWALKLVRF